MNGRGQKNFVLLLDREGFKSLYDFGEKRICDFGNNQSKNMASSGNQGARLPVGEIPEFGNGLPNAFCELRIDGGYLVDRARHCCRRDLGPPGYVTNVHESLFSPVDLNIWQYTLSRTLGDRVVSGGEEGKPNSAWPVKGAHHRGTRG